MIFLNDSEPIRIKKRDGSPENPYVDIEEQLVIYNNIAFLKEIPDEYERVVVKENDEYYNEVDKKEDMNDDKDYYVDYKEGKVYFKNAVNGKTLTFIYKGTGVILYPASRIYVDGETIPEQTLYDLITDAENKIIDTQTRADYAQQQGDYAKAQGNYAKQQGDYAASEVNNLNQLKTNVQNATTAANNAATNANNAATSATNAANSANTAANNANTQATNAQNAANNANTAATNANNAADNANTQATYAQQQGDYAKEQGDYAKQQGDYAKEQGDYAKQQGDYAASEASNLAQLKTDTQNATDAANSAATNANNAASAANTAATNATNQANYAKTQGDYAKAQGDYANAQGKLIDDLRALGTYDPTTTYKKNNIVLYNGSSYIAKQTTVGNPPTDTTYWELLAQRGTDGQGSVNSVNNKQPDVNGNITLIAADIGAETPSGAQTKADQAEQNAKNYLDNQKGQPNGVASLDGNGKVPPSQLPTATTTTQGAMSASDKAKLDGIQAGAEVNQNAFANIKVGATTIAADSETDTLELVAGANITLTPDATNDKVTIAVTGVAQSSHTHDFATLTNKPTTLSGYGITDAVPSSDVVTTPTANKILKLDGSGNLPTSITGNAATATKLQTSRTISLTGDVTGSTSFDGSANASISVTLANSGVTAGTYTKVTVDAKGRVTSGQSLSASDIPNLDWSKITTGKPTTLSGYGITDGVKNSGGVSSIQAGTDASKPSAGTSGRLYIATDTKKIYRDNGTSWDVIGGGVVDWSEITGKPTTVSGYGITDAVTTSQKGAANGVASLDGSSKVPIAQLPSASTSAAGIVQLNDTVTSTSTTQAATANAVKQAYDRAVSAENNAKNASLPRTGDTNVEISVKNALNVSGYRTSNTGVSNANKWTRLCSLRVTAQYGYVVADIDLLSGHDGSATAKFATVYVRLKQQNPMGQSPYCQLVIKTANGLTSNDIKGVVTANSATETILELWAKIPWGYEEIHFYPQNLMTSSGSFTPFELQAFSDTLPTGTQVNADVIFETPNGAQAKANQAETNAKNYLDNQKGKPNGVATLGADGKVPASQLPNISTTANGITITDSGGYYTGTNVEVALQEIGQVLNAMRGDLITSVNNILNM